MSRPGQRIGSNPSEVRGQFGHLEPYRRTKVSRLNDDLAKLLFSGRHSKEAVVAVGLDLSYQTIPS